MRKLEFNEFKACQAIAKIFEKSVDLNDFSSPIFIKRFMLSELTKDYFSPYYIALTSNEEELFDEFTKLYKGTKKITKYSENEMHWIGYIYGAIYFLFKMPPKRIYKLIPAKTIVKYYNIYHTFDVEEAAERIMENIGYQEIDYTKKGVEIMRKLYYGEQKIL